MLQHTDGGNYDTVRLILLSQKVARFEFENQLFEKVQGLARRC